MEEKWKEGFCVGKERRWRRAIKNTLSLSPSSNCYKFYFLSRLRISLHIFQQFLPSKLGCFRDYLEKRMRGIPKSWGENRKKFLRKMSGGEGSTLSERLFFLLSSLSLIYQNPAHFSHESAFTLQTLSGARIRHQRQQNDRRPNLDRKGGLPLSSFLPYPLYSLTI